MPFSTALEVQYKELVQAKFQTVAFEKPEDFLPFCTTMNAMVSAVSSDQSSQAIQKEALSEKLIASVNEFKELINEGFDLYATENIIHLTNKLAIDKKDPVNNAIMHTQWINIPAFTSADEGKKDVKITPQSKLQEARKEFINIIIAEIINNITELSKMTPEEKIKYISNRKTKQETAIKNYKIMKDSKAPISRSDTQNETNLMQTLTNLIIQARELILLNPYQHEETQSSQLLTGTQVRSQPTQHFPTFESSRPFYWTEDIDSSLYQPQLSHQYQQSFSVDAKNNARTLRHSRHQIYIIDEHVSSQDSPTDNERQQETLPPEHQSVHLDAKNNARSQHPLRHSTQQLFHFDAKNNDLPQEVINLSQETQISARQLNQFYLRRNNDPSYSKILALKEYLTNNAKRIRLVDDPYLSLEEVLAVTPQQQKNLITAYRYIDVSILTENDAKVLTEEQRLLMEKTTSNLDAMQKCVSAFHRPRPQNR
jgi:hypothetical protein